MTLLNQLLDYLKSALTFFMGLSLGYKMGSKKTQDLETQLEDETLAKKHLENLNKINNGESDDDIINELLGRDKDHLPK